MQKSLYSFSISKVMTVFISTLARFALVAKSTHYQSDFVINTAFLLAAGVYFQLQPFSSSQSGSVL